MPENTQLYNTIAPLRNVAALMELIEEVVNRNPSLPGLGVFHGPSGFGKTFAATYSVNEFEAYQIELKSCWTRKKLCQSLLGEMSIPPAKNISDMVDQISEELALSNRVLIIDEADYLVRANKIELVRDIYESSYSPVILIGEEGLPGKLAKWERVFGRVLSWKGAEPACLEDVGHLAPLYAPDLTLDIEFQKHLLAASKHSIRRVCTNLTRVNQFCRVQGVELITKDIWANREFTPAAAPRARNELVA